MSAAAREVERALREEPGLTRALRFRGIHPENYPDFNSYSVAALATEIGRILYDAAWEAATRAAFEGAIWSCE